MDIKYFDTKQALAQYASAEIVKQIKLNPCSRLGLATGSSPIHIYEQLVDAYKQQTISFKDVTAINLDEYYPISKKHPESYYTFMQTHLFDHTDFNPNNQFIPNGECAKDEIDSHCKEYDALFNVPCDIQLLGIGTNGHIGFNEPDLVYNPSTHLTNLTDETITANSRFFETIEQVPTQAITMGLKSILTAKRIFLIISGTNKDIIANRLLNPTLDPSIPADFLKLHSNIEVLIDLSTITIKK